MNVLHKRRFAVNLEGDIITKFDDIKDYLGIKTETEVVRHIITWYYRKVLMKKE